VLAATSAQKIAFSAISISLFSRSDEGKASIEKKQTTAISDHLTILFITIAQHIMCWQILDVAMW
jgi:hypothetical protein